MATNSNLFVLDYAGTLVKIWQAYSFLDDAETLVKIWQTYSFLDDAETLVEVREADLR